MKGGLTAKHNVVAPAPVQNHVQESNLRTRLNIGCSTI